MSDYLMSGLDIFEILWVSANDNRPAGDEVVEFVDFELKPIEIIPSN